LSSTAVSASQVKRLFVREAASQLASAASVALSPETAAGLAEICHTLMGKAEKSGAYIIAEFMGECKNLCSSILKNPSGRTAVEADEILKASFAAVRSALFNMALGDSSDAAGGLFDRYVARIYELTSEQAAPSRTDEAPPVEELEETNADTSAEPQPPAEEKSAWDSVHAAQTEQLQGAQKASPAERLMYSIARLAEKTQLDAELREMAFDVATAARIAHSFKFDKVCRHIGTDTPDALLDESLSKSAREQIMRWAREFEGVPGAVVSLRQVGGALWLEMRVPQAHVPQAHVPQPDAPTASGPPSVGPPVEGIAMTEGYALPDGMAIRRARLDLLLPAFKAYEVVFAGRKFLLPACDVESVFENPPAELERVALSSLLDLPADWKPRGRGRVTVSIKYRGSAKLVEVESARGPDTYLARNVSDAGPDLRGVIGVALLADGSRAAVLDVFPWLETYAERLEEQKKVEAGMGLSEEKYMVFKVSGRRYAVPMSAVATIGRVDSESLLTGTVETKKGVFHLRDMKEVLGFEGETGQLFIVIRSKTGTIAWAVDALDKVFVPLPGAMMKLRLAPFGYAHRGGRVQDLVKGILPGLLDPSELTPGGAVAPAAIYLINHENLVPSGRPVRRYGT